MSPIEIQARRDAREDALLGLAVPLHDARGLFGPKLLPLTPYHHLLLVGHKNPCFCGRGAGMRTLDTILQYLWFCSPACRPGAKLRFALFAWRWQFPLSEFRRTSSGRRVRGPTMRVLRAVTAHANQIYLDRPSIPQPRNLKLQTQNSKPELRDGPHELAALELLCRSALGYTRAEFWHTPYIHTNQLLTLHLDRVQQADPEKPKFDRARDRANGEWLRARKREREAAAKAQAARN